MATELVEWSALKLASPMAAPDQALSDLLAQYLACQNAAESERLLTELLWEQAAPIVERIVSSRVSGANTEDVVHDVMAHLLEQIRERKASGGPGIRDFRAYVAVASYNGCNECLRRCFPQRYRLRNRLRYLLEKDSRFELWESPAGDWICGHRDRQAAAPGGAAGPSGAAWASSREAAHVVDGIFAEAGCPIAFDDLVDRLAHYWGISDHTSANLEILSTDASIHTDLERRAWLKRLWDEIGALPLRQRWALLLNLRDDLGGPALTLLPVTGVATMRQIAAAMEMDPMELARLWNDLPLEDQRIADRLQVSRQQVINLRRAARERLSRRLA
jgi:hypothetical protein